MIDVRAGAFSWNREREREREREQQNCQDFYWGAKRKRKDFVFPEKNLFQQSLSKTLRVHHLSWGAKWKKKRGKKNVYQGSDESVDVHGVRKRKRKNIEKTEKQRRTVSEEKKRKKNVPGQR